MALGSDVRSCPGLFHLLISQFKEDVKEPTWLFKKFRGSFPCGVVYLISLHASFKSWAGWVTVSTKVDRTAHTCWLVCVGWVLFCSSLSSNCVACWEAEYQSPRLCFAPLHPSIGTAYWPFLACSPYLFIFHNRPLFPSIKIDWRRLLRTLFELCKLSSGLCDIWCIKIVWCCLWNGPRDLPTVQLTIHRYLLVDGGKLSLAYVVGAWKW